MELRRRDVILAAVVAFVSWGFLTHWIRGIRFLPYAFVAGVVVSLGGLLWLVLSTARPHPHHGAQQGIYGGKNVAFVAPKAWALENISLKSRLRYRRQPLYPPSRAISDNLDVVLGNVMRDFVKSWYGNISRRPTFTNEADRAVRVALGNIRDRIMSLDIVEMMVMRMVPIITAHMKECNAAEFTVRGRKLSRNVTESEELDLAIAGKYKEGLLHPAASLNYSDTKMPQQQHLRGVVLRLLPQVLPRNMTTSASVNVLIKEIVACAVLFPMMQLLSDPDTWNQLLEAYGRTILQDRKTVKKLRAALDQQTPASPKPQKQLALPRLSPDDSERKFEKFIRMIRHINSLSDARRFRSEIASQLRKEEAMQSQNPLYMKRLETAKRTLDQRIAHLATVNATRVEGPPARPPAQPRKPSRADVASLRDVLYNASGLSYFMEYMDRPGLMRMVQFWIVVDGFRNPLEVDTDEPQSQSGTKITWTESDRADLAQIYEAYLTRPEIKVSEASLISVKEFLRAGNHATEAQYRAARRAVLQGQTAIYEEMQEFYFPGFKKSDLYYKWLAVDDTLAPPPAMQTPEPASPINPTRSTRPSFLSRVSSTATSKPKSTDLRRAVASSTDLKGFVKSSEAETRQRRSLDDSSPRRPLFDDHDESEPLANSVASLDSDFESAPLRNSGEEARAVDAIQDALDTLVDDNEDKDSLFSESSLRSPQDGDSLRGSLEVSRPIGSRTNTDREKPSLSSLGLVGTPSRRGVFSEDALFGEEEKFIEDEREDSDVNDKSDDDQIHEAAPGDLGLTEAIDAMTADIERLVSQENIVNTLTNKAELTNNAAELRILRKSKASLQREIRRKELQRQQYIVQESDNSLYGRATVSIKSIMVGNDEEGHEFALYVIEVQRQASEQMPAAAWVIARRYSEFHLLNKRLRARYQAVRNIDFPRRQVVFKLQRDFLQKRRAALERYLRELLLLPAVCRSRELRAFLSQQAILPTGSTDSQMDTRDFVTRIYNSVTDGMEEFLGNIPVLDQLSLAGQNLITAATTQYNMPPTAMATSPVGVGNDTAASAEAEAELRAFENRELEPFVKPICDLFLEVFELNRDNNWLRGRAVVVVLHQLLGGTIERKSRDMFKTYTQEKSVLGYLDMLKNMMWPGGRLRTAGPARTSAEKAKSKKEAGLVLSTLIPELSASVVGRGNAHAASRRIWAAANNERLNTHLAYTLLDEMISVLFSETMIR